MAQLGEEIMMLDGLDLGAAPRFRGIPRMSKRSSAMHELCNFKKTHIYEGCLTRQCHAEQSLGDYSSVASSDRPSSGSGAARNEIENVKARLIVRAAQDFSGHGGIKVTRILREKVGSLNALLMERRKVVKDAKDAARKQLRLLKKLDRVAASTQNAVKAASAAGDKAKAAALAKKFIKIHERRMAIADEIVRLMKLHTVAVALAKNATSQIILNQITANAVVSGSPQTAALAVNALVATNDTATRMKAVRKKQIKAWSSDKSIAPVQPLMPASVVRRIDEVADGFDDSGEEDAASYLGDFGSAETDRVKVMVMRLIYKYKILHKDSDMKGRKLDAETIEISSWWQSIGGDRREKARPVGKAILHRMVPNAEYDKSYFEFILLSPKERENWMIKRFLKLPQKDRSSIVSSYKPDNSLLAKATRTIEKALDLATDVAMFPVGVVADQVARTAEEFGDKAKDIICTQAVQDFLNSPAAAGIATAVGTVALPPPVGTMSGSAAVKILSNVGCSAKAPSASKSPMPETTSHGPSVKEVETVSSQKKKTEPKKDSKKKHGKSDKKKGDKKKVPVATATTKVPLSNAKKGVLATFAAAALAIPFLL
jgi:hypothetical protein